MQIDFHYYATYCAAYLAGYTIEESRRIAYSAQFVDCCSKELLKKIGAPAEAATTQLQLELMNSSEDPISLLNITRIWASFHFLPGDLNARPEKGGFRYRNKYRLICDTNGDLLRETAELAKGKGEEAAGIAMHVLADTWAHRYFAGIPSLVINNTNYYFYEIFPSGNGMEEREIRFNHNPASPDDPVKGIYTNSVFRGNENSVMNLGHGRAGHLPDYSYARYRYMPAWGGCREIIKDNPSDYMHAFCQMIYAMQYLRSEGYVFETDRYAWDTAAPYRTRIEEILNRRQLNACADWKQLGKDITGEALPDFDLEKYQKEYTEAGREARRETFFGRFTEAAAAQKNMVSGRMYPALIRYRRQKDDKK